MGTFVPSGKNIDRKWFVMDASGQTLGRLATKAASVLAGKLNPQYVPYIDVGDFVIVINAEKVRLTGLKSQQKLYRRYTGFPGGLREESFTRLLARRPERSWKRPSRACCPRARWAAPWARSSRSTRATSIPTRRSSRWRWKWRKSSGQRIADSRQFKRPVLAGRSDAGKCCSRVLQANVEAGKPRRVQMFFHRRQMF